MNDADLEKAAADLGLPDAVVDGLVRLLGGEISLRLPEENAENAEKSRAASVFFNQIAGRVDALVREHQQREKSLESSVESLVDGLVKIAAGEFSYRFERDQHGNAMDVLAFLVNNMVDELVVHMEQAKARADEDRQRLQTLVDEQTLGLRSTNLELNRKNDQLVAAMETLEQTYVRLVQSEKMAALGQLVASVAHELNTPLGAIRASVDNLTVTTDVALGPLLETLADTPGELRAEWLGLVRSAKVEIAPRSSREERAARRRVVNELQAAGIVDGDNLASLLSEVGLSGGIGELTSVMRLLHSDQRAELLHAAHAITGLRRSAHNIRTAADRASRIVFALKIHAHPGSVDGARTRASLSENLDTVLVLYQSQIKRSVEVVRDYQDPGHIEGHHDELNQVWTNLMHNALQAMSNSGRLDVSVRCEGGDVVVAITDSGPGIPPENQARIFEPFFTTKGAGEGSGLGLSISQNIVAKHGGRMAVESEPGRTCFTVRLRARWPQDDRKDKSA